LFCHKIKLIPPLRDLQEPLPQILLNEEGLLSLVVHITNGLGNKLVNEAESIYFEDYNSNLEKPGNLPFIRILNPDYWFVESDNIKDSESYENRHLANNYFVKLNLVKNLVKMNGLTLSRPPYIILPDRNNSDYVKLLTKTDPLAFIKYNIENILNGDYNNIYGINNDEDVNRFDNLASFVHNLIEGNIEIYHGLKTPAQAIFVFSSYEEMYKGLYHQLEKMHNLKEIILR